MAFTDMARMAFYQRDKKKQQPDPNVGYDLPEETGSIVRPVARTPTRDELMRQSGELTAQEKQIRAHLGEARRSKNIDEEARQSYALGLLHEEIRKMNAINAPVNTQSREEMNRKREELRAQAEMNLEGQFKDATSRASAPPDYAGNAQRVGENMQYGYGPRPDPRNFSAATVASGRDAQRFAATAPYMNGSGQISTPSMDSLRTQEMFRAQAQNEAHDVTGRLAKVKSGETLGPLSDPEYAAVNQRRNDTMERKQDAASWMDRAWADRQASLGNKGSAPISTLGVEVAKGKQADDAAFRAKMEETRAREMFAKRAAEGDPTIDVARMEAATRLSQAHRAFNAEKRTALMEDNPEAARIAGDIVSGVKSASGVRINTPEEQGAVDRMARASGDIGKLPPEAQAIVARQVLEALQAEGLDLPKEAMQNEQVGAFLAQLPSTLVQILTGGEVLPSDVRSQSDRGQHRINNTLAEMQRIRERTMLRGGR